MNNAIELTSQTFEQEVLRSPLPVLVDFWAPWCAPCRLMAPVLDQLAVELAGKIKITKLNIDDPAHQNLAIRYRVQGIPNMQIFRNGSVIQELVGARPKELLKKDIEAAL